MIIGETGITYPVRFLGKSDGDNIYHFTNYTPRFIDKILGRTEKNGYFASGIPIVNINEKNFVIFNNQSLNDKIMKLNIGRFVIPINLLWIKFNIVILY